MASDARRFRLDVDALVEVFFDLTRRANQGHINIIARIVTPAPVKRQPASQWYSKTVSDERIAEDKLGALAKKFRQAARKVLPNHEKRGVTS